MKKSTILKEFTPEILKPTKIRLRGSADCGRTSVSDIVSRAIGEEPSGAFVLAYMIRRFGFPTEFCDGYKEVANWYLSTPMKGVYLSVYPLGGSGWGYICSPSIHKKILEGIFQTRRDWNKRIVKWAKEVHKINLFTPRFSSFMSIPVVKKGDKLSYKTAPFKIAAKEYNIWEKENGHKDLTGEQSMELFRGEFAKFKDEQIKEYVSLYEKNIEPCPEDQESETAILVQDALSRTAKDFLKYTYVRDVYMNVFGGETKERVEQSRTFFGEDFRVSYVDPNTYITAYKAGKGVKSNKDGK